jgi:proteasome lid subunit RPN8/RPN11
MNSKLILTLKTWQAMRRHVSRCAPLEGCGLLTGNKERVERSQGIPNAEKSPVRYRMEPRAQWRAFQRIEAAGLELIGIYHSHPNGPNHLSPTDLAEAMYSVVQVIWFRENGKWRARGFIIERDNAFEITLEVTEPE